MIQMSKDSRAIASLCDEPSLERQDIATGCGAQRPPDDALGESCYTTAIRIRPMRALRAGAVKARSGAARAGGAKRRGLDGAEHSGMINEDGGLVITQLAPEGSRARSTASPRAR